MAAVAERVAADRRLYLEQHRLRAEKEAAEAAVKEAAEAQARQVRESDLKRRRAAEAREAAETVRREEEEAEAALEAQRLRAKHKLDEQLRRDREAAAECARFNSTDRRQGHCHVETRLGVESVVGEGAG